MVPSTSGLRGQSPAGPAGVLWMDSWILGTFDWGLEKICLARAGTNWEAKSKRTHTMLPSLSSLSSLSLSDDYEFDTEAGVKRSFPDGYDRDTAVERNGENRQKEQDIVIQFQEAAGGQNRGQNRLMIMNDFTISDAIFKPDDKKFTEDTEAIALQFKTTEPSDVKDKPHQYHFSNTKGYSGMLVLCITQNYRAYNNNVPMGWIFDGTYLNSASKDIWVTHPKATEPKNKSGKGKKPTDHLENSLSGENPLPLKDLVTKLDLLWEKKKEDGSWKYERTNYYKETWKFNGLDHFKERITLHIYKTKVDEKAEFPLDVQGARYDLVNKTTEQKIQCKSAVMKIDNGKVNLGLEVVPKTMAGKNENGVRISEPYTEGDFDILAVFYLDWVTRKAHVWKIPASWLVHNSIMRKNPVTPPSGSSGEGNESKEETREGDQECQKEGQEENEAGNEEESVAGNSNKRAKKAETEETKLNTAFRVYLPGNEPKDPKKYNPEYYDGAYDFELPQEAEDIIKQKYQITGNIYKKPGRD